MGTHAPPRGTGGGCPVPQHEDRTARSGKTLSRSAQPFILNLDRAAKKHNAQRCNGFTRCALPAKRMAGALPLAESLYLRPLAFTRSAARRLCGKDCGQGSAAALPNPCGAPTSRRGARCAPPNVQR